MQETPFKNENLEIQAQFQPGCLVELKVHVLPHAVRAAYEKAVKSVKKEVSIPGFRKGKAPDAVIVKSFDKDIQKECRDLVLQTGYKEALHLVQRFPFAKNSVRKAQIKTFSLESGAELLFVYEAEPSVPRIVLEEVEIPQLNPKPVTQEEVDKERKRVQLSYASWEEIPDRAVCDQDFVVIDIDALDHPAHNVCMDKLFHVETREMSQWMYTCILGMQKNESREGVAEPDPNHPFEQDNTTPKRCRITLKAIKKATMSPYDDAFAKTVQCETIEELEKKITEAVSYLRGQEARTIARSELCHTLLQKYPFDLPQSLIETEAKRRIHASKSADMKRGNLPLDPVEEERIEHEVQIAVNQFFTCMYLLRQFANQVNLSVSQNEVMQEISSQFQEAPLERFIYPGQSQEEMQERILIKLMMRKCADYLLDQARVSTQ